MKPLHTILLIIFLASESHADPSWLQTFDNDMVSSTFKIVVGNSSGTAFVLGKPVPWANTNNLSSMVLITAAHVLNNSQSSNATIFLRIKKDDIYEKREYTIRTRANGTNLWVQHPNADIAVMPITLPMDTFGAPIPSTELLLSDREVKEEQIHIGDELRVLGYPLGMEANEFGFPILRSGRIASYPLTPANKIHSFLLDFRVFPGNSGGPVYILDQRQYLGGSPETVTTRAILGLISEEAQFKETVNSMTETMVKTHDLGLGVVIPAQLIKETIDLLPPIENPEGTL